MLSTQWDDLYHLRPSYLQPVGLNHLQKKSVIWEAVLFWKRLSHPDISRIGRYNCCILPARGQLIRMIWILVKNRRTITNVLVFVMQDIPSVSLIGQVCWIGAIGFANLHIHFPLAPSSPPCPFIIGPACCTNLKIWQSSR